MSTAHGTWADRDGVIVRLQNEGGAAGFGEAAAIPWFGTETVEELETACRELGEKVDASRLAAVPEKLSSLRNALDAAQRELGGSAPKIETMSLGVAALLPAGRNAISEMARKAEAGFRIFKWKVGVADAADELALLDDVCAALPSGGKLRLDANGAWDRRVAERWLERCAERPVEFVEQPCFERLARHEAASKRIDDMLLGLAEDYPTPIALDESLVRDGDVARWLGAGWRGVFVVKPSLFADVDRVLAQLAKAKASVVFSSALETAVGARAALRWAFSWKGEPRALGFGIWPLFQDARFDAPFVAPFIRSEDVEHLNPEVVWNALN